MTGCHSGGAGAPRCCRNRPEKADQVEIGGGKLGFGHGRGAIPPTSTHADSPGQGGCNTLRISSGLTTKITRLPPVDIDFRKRPIGNSGGFFCYAFQYPRGTTMTSTVKPSDLLDRSLMIPTGFDIRPSGSYTKHTRNLQFGCFLYLAISSMSCVPSSLQSRPPRVIFTSMPSDSSLIRKSILLALPA